MGRRRKIERRSIEPNVRAAVSYIDTVRIRLPKLMEKREFRQLRLAMFRAQGTRKRRIVLTKRYYPPHRGGWFYVMSIHQPTQAAIELLIQEDRRPIEAHLALDLPTLTWGDAWDAQAYLEHRIQRTARPTEYSKWREATVYLGRLKSRIGPELVLYSDLRSKAGNLPCCHTELRIIGKSAMRAAGLFSAKDLLTLNYRQFWDRHLRLYKPPTLQSVINARLRMLRKRGLPASPDSVEHTAQKYFRASKGHNDVLVGSDLLCFLRQSTNMVGKHPLRLFRRESHAWMLPASPQNALWVEDSSNGPARESRARIGGKPRSNEQEAEPLVQHSYALPTTEHDSDDELCLATTMSVWRSLNDACPHCGCISGRFYRVAGRPAFVCGDCRGHIYPCVGTPLEKSRIPLHTWFRGLRLANGPGKPVTAAEFQRQLGVTYKTAWRMRRALEQHNPFWRTLSLHAQGNEFLG